MFLLYDVLRRSTFRTVLATFDFVTKQKDMENVRLGSKTHNFGYFLAFSQLFDFG